MKKTRLKCISNNNNYYVAISTIVHNLQEAVLVCLEHNVAFQVYHNPFDIENKIKQNGFAEINIEISLDRYIDELLSCKELFNEKEFWLIYKTIMNFFKTATKNKSKLARYLLKLQDTFAECKKYQYQIQKFNGKMQDSIIFYSKLSTEINLYFSDNNVEDKID